MLPRLTSILVFLVAAVSLPQCRCKDSLQNKEPVAGLTDFNAPVILISLDTLRADHVGAYGYPRPTTPHLDAFAQESVVFEECIAQAPSTLPSHASIFTSQIVSHHGALFSRLRGLTDEALTMAELLSAEGFACWGLHDGGQMDPVFGLGQGFDIYEMVSQPATGWEAWRTVARAKELLEQRRTDRFFLFLHTYGVHHPYCAEGEFVDLFVRNYHGSLSRCLTKEVLISINERERFIGEEDARHIIDMYDAGIRSVDASVGLFLAYLKDLGLYEKSLIVVTSDHGEELGERGRHGWHSHALFDEQIRVPLIVKLPRAELGGTRVAAQVRSIDILPTILDLFGLNLSASFEGSSLLDLARGAQESLTRPAVSERDVTDAVLPAILRGLDWKYENRSQESRTLLFDLRVDPGELMDVLSKNEEVAQKMKVELEALVGSRPMPVGPVSTFSDSLTEQLRSLGYLTETLDEK